MDDTFIGPIAELVANIVSLRTILIIIGLMFLLGIALIIFCQKSPELPKQQPVPVTKDI